MPTEAYNSTFSSQVYFYTANTTSVKWTWGNFDVTPPKPVEPKSLFDLAVAQG